MIRSIPLGAAVAAVAIVVFVLIAVEASGYVRIFGENRGLLQFFVVIPLAALAAGWCLAFWSVFTPAQMAWAMAPVEAFILLGLWTLGALAWTSALAISAVVLIPWTAGLLAGPVYPN